MLNFTHFVRFGLLSHALKGAGAGERRWPYKYIYIYIYITYENVFSSYNENNLLEFDEQFAIQHVKF